MKYIERQISQPIMEDLIDRMQVKVQKDEILSIKRTQYKQTNNCVIVVEEITDANNPNPRTIISKNTYKHSHSIRETLKEFVNKFGQSRPQFEVARVVSIVYDDVRSIQLIQKFDTGYKLMSQPIDPVVFDNRDDISYQIICFFNKDSINVLDEQFMSVIINNIAEEYLSLLYKIKPLFGSKYALSIKELLPNPKQLTMNDIIVRYPWQNFVLAAKADGLRKLLVFDNDNVQIMDDLQVNQFKYRAADSRPFAIIQAELCDQTLWCYDITHISSDDLREMPYTERLVILQEYIQNDLIIDEMRLKLKPVREIGPNSSVDKLEEIFKWAEQQEFITDGIILTENVGIKGSIFKWKPRSHLSVDLYVERTSNKSNTYMLYTFMSKQDFRQSDLRVPRDHQPRLKLPNLIILPFQSALVQYYTQQYDHIGIEDLDGKVCEFIWTPANKWKLLRIRTDKDPKRAQLGNYYLIAQSVFQEMIYFIEYEQLYRLNNIDLYFKQYKDDIYRSMTAFINGCKQKLITQYCSNKKVVVDLGCGKGQDIMKYVHAKVKTLYCVDNDKEALKTLYLRQLYLKLPEGIPQKPTVKLIKSDLKDKNDTRALSSINKYDKIDCIICNLSAHYFQHNISVILQQLKHNIVKGCHLVFVVLDSEKIVASEDILVEQNNQIKYQIQKQFAGNTLANSGQHIKIKLPFSDQLMDEELLNVSKLSTEVGSFGFRLLRNESLPIIDNIAFQKLADDDKMYVSLYKCVVYVF